MQPIHRLTCRSLYACLAIAACSTSVFATSKAYQGPDNGNFGTAANWSPTGVPASADDVTIGTLKPAGLTGDLHVTLTSTLSVNSITLNSSAVPAFAILNQTTGFINVVTENIGLSVSDNTYNQSGSSTNGVTTLNIAAGSSVGNNYNILAGSTATLNVFSNLNVGVVGNGSFTQASGNVTVSNGSENALLTLGVNANSTGTYNLQNGILSADSIQIGQAGNAVFNQSGGFFESFFPASVSSTAGTAVYNYSGGGIIVSHGALSIGTNGTFNLTGGSLSYTPPILTGGTFNVAGGSIDASDGVLLQGGTLQLQGNSVAVAQLSGTGVIQNGSASLPSLPSISPSP